MDNELIPLVQEWKVRGSEAVATPTTLKALRSAILLEGVPVGSSEVPGSLNCDNASWK